MSDGRSVDIPLIESLVAAELARQKPLVDAERYVAYEEAAELTRQLVRAPKFVEFLTLPAYRQVLMKERLAEDSR